MMDAVEKTVDKEQEKLADKCKDDSKAGKTIKAKDHDCFMKGEGFDDWRNCKFETGRTSRTPTRSSSRA